jgi:hypothetical protein
MLMTIDGLAGRSILLIVVQVSSNTTGSGAEVIKCSDIPRQLFNRKQLIFSLENDLTCIYLSASNA